MADLWVNGIVWARDKQPYIQLANEKGIIAQFSMAEARQVALDILVMCSRSEADATILKFFEKYDFPSGAAAALMSFATSAPRSTTRQSARAHGGEDEPAKESAFEGKWAGRTKIGRKERVNLRAY